MSAPAQAPTAFQPTAFPICAIGLSHRTAPVAVRELYAFDDEGAGGLVRTLAAVDGVREAVLLSTCNRTEVYAVGCCRRDVRDLGSALVAALASARGKAAGDLAPHLYVMEGIDAVRHLFRVAASLDSMVVGEPQILGQVKNAYRVACEAGTVGPALARFHERAFKVAKEVRTTTGVGTGQVSVGSVAVDLARRVFGDLSKSTVLLLGAGKMAEAVARTLAAGGAGRVVVANRTVERAMKVAETYGWSGAALSDLADLLAGADVVVASLASPGYVIDRAAIKAALARRPFRPFFLVDIAVPRVLDPGMSSVEGVYLYNIDDFNQIIQEGLGRRAQDVRKAEEVVAREVTGVERFLRSAAIQPLVAAIGRRATELRDRELARALKDLPDLTEAETRVITAFAASLAGKLASDPQTVLRQAAGEGGGEVAALADAAQRLFRGADAETDETQQGEGQRE
ncbi:MAG: glutamyl-tRNA reductase [Deltaproteobacteria bacterium]|nr:glutamyl-tRNA reductase [Deltaproteobacteria bacterium]